CARADPDARLAFVHTLRTIIAVGGRGVGAADRLYLAAEVPVLLVWGEQDPMIPVAHARVAHQTIPGSRLTIFPTAGHFPHRDEPRRFVETLLEFLQSTPPARLEAAQWQRMLRAGGGRPAWSPGPLTVSVQ